VCTARRRQHRTICSWSCRQLHDGCRSVTVSSHGGAREPAFDRAFMHRLSIRRSGAPSGTLADTPISLRVLPPAGSRQLESRSVSVHRPRARPAPLGIDRRVSTARGAPELNPRRGWRCRHHGRPDIARGAGAASNERRWSASAIYTPVGQRWWSTLPGERRKALRPRARRLSLEARSSWTGVDLVGVRKASDRRMTPLTHGPVRTVAKIRSGSP